MPPPVDPSYQQARLGAQAMAGGSPFMDPNIRNAAQLNRQRQRSRIQSSIAASPNIRAALGAGAPPRRPPASPMTGNSFGFNPTAAWNNIASAFATRQPGPRPDLGQVVEPGVGEGGQLGSESQPVDPTKGMVMSYAASGAPIYYGTQDARDLAIRGLERVVRGYGWNHPRAQQALQNALGVLGPEYASMAAKENFMAPPITPKPGVGAGPQVY